MRVPDMRTGHRTVEALNRIDKGRGEVNALSRCIQSVRPRV